ncbi:NUDIX domain-containing protein [Micromonospora sp. NPDC005172]|uniref:NUDIX domain-containing protein n=1 Tax=Micromonospora sp. NPDC005172 TaxID=3156867 RepID=UPI0033BDD3CE
MAISSHLARLRAVIGHELIQLPSVVVLVVDDDARLLLVRHTGEQNGWAVPGGAVDIGESAAEAAAREIREEIGVQISQPRLLTVLGGTDYEVTYANGDRVAYVPAVYEAGIVDGTPVPDQEEISELDWFTRSQLQSVDLNRFSRALLRATGHLAS